MRRVPDTTLCKRMLGVEAEVSLDDGLRRRSTGSARSRRQDAAV